MVRLGKKYPFSVPTERSRRDTKQRDLADKTISENIYHNVRGRYIWNALLYRGVWGFGFSSVLMREIFLQ